MLSGDGPIQTRPASITAAAKRELSERKPYPGCTASAPLRRAMSISLAMSR
jgi:hypothetical protein